MRPQPCSFARNGARPGPWPAPGLHGKIFTPSSFPSRDKKETRLFLLRFARRFLSCWFLVPFPLFGQDAPDADAKAIHISGFLFCETWLRRSRCVRFRGSQSHISNCVPLLATWAIAMLSVFRIPRGLLARMGPPAEKSPRAKRPFFGAS